MNRLYDFDSHLNRVFQSCRDIISSYPYPYRKEGLKYLEKYDHFKEGSTKNYICYLLPFWISDVIPVEPDICCGISLANTFQMLYFFIQDDVMDAGPAGVDKSGILPLGNLFFMDFMDRYQRLFPSDSDFWSYLKRYFEQWSCSMACEKRQEVALEGDFNTVAWKAAPLKAASTAVCLLGGREEVIEDVSNQVDSVLATLQLLDDWNDWKEDVASGSISYFLSEVMKYCDVKSMTHLNESHIRKAVFIGDILEKVLALAKRNHSVLQGSRKFDIPYLKAFSNAILEDLHQILHKVNQEKNAMMRGGFSYWLYTNIK